MKLEIPAPILEQIHRYAEANYPHEGAGFLLGQTNGPSRQVRSILPLTNARIGADRRNRYLIGPQDLLRGEREADQRGLTLLGVYHSHPDHPPLPSQYDREWALPWFSYLITSVEAGQATRSRSWRLSDDREQFFEEALMAIDPKPGPPAA